MGLLPLVCNVDRDNAAFANHLVERVDDVLNAMGLDYPGAAVASAVEVNAVIRVNGHVRLCFVHGVTSPTGGISNGRYLMPELHNWDQ